MKLKDSDRELVFQFVVTTRCNLRCNNCSYGCTSKKANLVYRHTFSNMPKALKEEWDNIKECRSKITSSICINVMNTKIYFCSNMIEILNNQAFNKYKHIELKESSDYVSVSKINSINDLIPYLKGCYSLCCYCAKGVVTPWSTSIKVKQI